MEPVMEINGETITRETVRQWLVSKHVALWSDWLITRPAQQDEAINWIFKQMSQLSAFASNGPDPDLKPNDGPTSFRVLTAA